MLRLISRAAALSKPRDDTVLASASPLLLNHQLFYATKSKGNKKQEDNKKSKFKPSDSAAALQSDSAASADDSESAKARARRLADDDRDPSLDVGPNNRPLFTKATSLSLLTRKDASTYFKFRWKIWEIFCICKCLNTCHVVIGLFVCSEKELNAVLPEGLPTGMLTEFKESMRHALLVRQSFLDLRDNFRRVVDPPLSSSNGESLALCCLIFFCFFLVFFVWIIYCKVKFNSFKIILFNLLCFLFILKFLLSWELFLKL